MFTIKTQSAGGQVMAKRQREAALAKYYENPKICLSCHKVIGVRANEKVSEIRRKTYCNLDCAATKNNSHPSHFKKERVCSVCGDPIPYRQKTTAKYCNSCLRIKRDVISGLTKSELFARRNGYQSARSSIRRHAELVFGQSGKSRACEVCGYNKTSEICHRQSVSDFSSITLISEINAIENLVCLCPNHHWEFDHGLVVV